MLQVGIHENVVVNKAIINEKNTLEIGFLQPGNTDAAAALAGNAGLGGGETVNIRMFGPQIDYFGKIRSGADMLVLIVNFKATLTHLLSAFIADPTIDATKGIPLENLSEAFTDQKVVDVAYANIISQFVALITPFLEKDKIRVKFPKKSKDSKYAGIPRFGDWVESMAIPSEASKLKFSDWEIKNNFHISDVATDTVTDDQKEEQLDNLGNLFGKQEEADQAVDQVVAQGNDAEVKA